MIISTKHIRYLERDYLDYFDGKISEIPKNVWVPKLDNLHFIKILGISRFWDKSKEKLESAFKIMEDLLSGFYGGKVSLIYLIMGEKSKINLYLAIYPHSRVPTKTDDALPDLTSSLKSAFPGLECEVQSQKDLKLIQNAIKRLSYAGMIFGTPTVKASKKEYGFEQIERLIRGLYGRNWCYLVISTPIDEIPIIKLFNMTLDELRLVASAEKSADMKGPITEKYKEILNILLKKIQLGKNQGMWNTSAYFLCEDQKSYDFSKSLIKSVFSGEKSLPDPIKILQCNKIKNQISNFSQFLTQGDKGPGAIRYPFKYLGLLNSQELTSFIHFPTQEMPGYRVKNYARFDVAPCNKDGESSLELGEIIDAGNKMNYKYEINIDDLNRHGLVVGMTGSGKTNSIFGILKNLWSKKIPFLVIEPAKSEYRKLLQDKGLKKDLQIFTLGDETTSPFRLNPFEILPGVSVQTHIDLLKSVFNASFVMYAPMPYILERCLHEIYEDKGWDLATNQNKRGLHINANPTLSDLYTKIGEVVRRLGYEEKLTMDFRAALEARLNSLRIGGKGLMLDTKTSIPMGEILGKPTILELEQIGDDDEKAFIIGLLLTFLYEYYVAKGLEEGQKLRHLTIIEEAHRLLKNVPTVQDTETANIKGKAVETFSNILSEVRAYGEGFLIAEQIPSKLAIDVIKNTNLKIMHRIVAEDDRKLMAGTMNLTNEQSTLITSLKTGQACVYEEGEDNPLLVEVPYNKEETKVMSKSQENTSIAKSMKKTITGIGPGTYKVPSDLISKYKKEALEIIDKREFNEILLRYILSVSLHERSLAGELPLLIKTIFNLSENVNEESMISAAVLYGIEFQFEKLGQKFQLNYEDIERTKNQFLNVLIPIITQKTAVKKNFSSKELNSIKLFQKNYKKLLERNYLKFPTKNIPKHYYLYEYNIENLLTDKQVNVDFEAGLRNASKNNNWKTLFEVCLDAAKRIASDAVLTQEGKSIAFCVAMQKINRMEEIAYYDKEFILQELIKFVK